MKAQRLQEDSLTRPRNKAIQAFRVALPPDIDGSGSDSCWLKAAVAGDFVEYGPRNGIPSMFRTEARFVYDDQALYVLVTLYDPAPDSIDSELGRRDEVESLNADRISIDILPYNDGLNMYEFKVSPAGIQNDVKYTAVGQDPLWNAVWECETSITATGWIAEFKIPFSALRFPAKPVQNWGINLWRNVNRRQNWSTWCYVNNNTDNLFRYYGELSGMENIQSPPRLSLSPFLAGYAEKTPDKQNWSYLAKGGLDLKYGITDSYTLDMVLVPDFGQVQSDEEILNLTPFEVQYDENRQFFTEGTELFDKCNIFYSRRIGSTPLHHDQAWDQLKAHEVLEKNPEETRLINATKISGRNSQGLGLGLFNAMTASARAVIKDTLSGEKRDFTTQAFTNYNVAVIDQSLPNNSYLTFINTNLSIPREDYSANVTGGECVLNNKRNTLEWIGQLVVSQKYQAALDPSFGHRFFMYLGKPSGKFQYSVYRDQTDASYDPNDMGFLTHNNIAYNRLHFTYLNSVPRRKILQTKSNLQVFYNTRYKDNEFSDLFFELSHYTNYLSYWSIYFMARIHPLGYIDFYEPRTAGYFYEEPAFHSFVVDINSDSRKTIQTGIGLNAKLSPSNHNHAFVASLDPRVRVSDRLSISLSASFDKENSNRGFVNAIYEEPGGPPQIIFGRRDLTTVSNSLLAKYIFGRLSSISCKLRHYWSKAKYLDYHYLNTQGKLLPTPYQGEDLSFKVFTIDMQYTWNFAPGSELSIVWKNSIRSLQAQVEDSYWMSLENTFREPQSNSLSFKAIYHIDYVDIRNKVRRSHGKNHRS